MGSFKFIYYYVVSASLVPEMCRMDCNCINRKIFVYVYERIAEIHSPRYTWVSRQTLELLFTCLFCCCSTVALYYLSCIFVCVLPRLMTLPAAHFCDACRTWNTHESRVLSMYTTSTTIHIMMMIIIVVCFFFWERISRNKQAIGKWQISGITCTKFPLF